MVTVKCTLCGAAYEIGEKDIGKVFVCEGCGHDFVAMKKPPVSSSAAQVRYRTCEHSRSVPKSESPGALSICRYCGGMISPKTLCCPKCGAHRLYRPLMVITYVFYVALVLSIITAVVAVAADICSDLLR